MNNKKVVEKIKSLRVACGLTQDYMAEKLSISRSAYQKIESGDSHAWAKYMNNLMDILGTTSEKFFSDIEHVGVVIHDNLKGSVEKYLEVFHREKCEFYEKLLAAKDKQIALLEKLLDKK